MGKEQKEYKPFTKEESESKVMQYIKSEHKLTATIGLYAKAKKIHFIDQLHLNSFYKKNQPFALELTPYPLTRIIQTMKHLVDNVDFKWTLGTVDKYIDEDIDALDGREPIIKLRDGECIYDTARLTSLEREGVIYYDNKKWFER